MSRNVYAPDLSGIARLMEDKAGDRLDQLLLQTSQLLAAIAAEHECNGGPGECTTCDDALWPCVTYSSALEMAVSWLIDEVR